MVVPKENAGILEGGRWMGSALRYHSFHGPVDWRLITPTRAMLLGDIALCTCHRVYISSYEHLTLQWGR